MAEATKRCGFQVVSDGTPSGTKIYYQPEEGERVQINCVSEFSMKMNGENSFYDITLIGELLGLELEVGRKQVRVTHDVQPPSPAPVWVPQQPLPLLEAMSMETFKGCLKSMERQPIKCDEELKNYARNRGWVDGEWALDEVENCEACKRGNGSCSHTCDKQPLKPGHVRVASIEEKPVAEFVKAQVLDDSYYNGKPAPAVLTESAPSGYWSTKQ